MTLTEWVSDLIADGRAEEAAKLLLNSPLLERDEAEHELNDTEMRVLKEFGYTEVV